MSFGLLNYILPLFHFLHPLFPVLHSHFSQVMSELYVHEFVCTYLLYMSRNVAYKQVIKCKNVAGTKPAGKCLFFKENKT